MNSINRRIAFTNHDDNNYVPYPVEHINAITPFTVQSTVNGAIEFLKSISAGLSDSNDPLPVRSLADLTNSVLTIEGRGGSVPDVTTVLERNAVTEECVQC